MNEFEEFTATLNEFLDQLVVFLDLMEERYKTVMKLIKKLEEKYA